MDEDKMSKSCYYQAVNGVLPSRHDCEVSCTGKMCDDCEWYLEEPQQGTDKNAQDKLPY